MRPRPPIVVFCDLDDTLFEPHRFCVDVPTRLAFGRIEGAHVPIVFCSSKTRAELALIQEELGISHPFICEHGAAAFVPQGYFDFSVARAREAAGYDVVEFGKTKAEIVASLRRTAARLDIGIVEFSKMSIEDVAIDCALPLLHARLAKLREYSEQFRVIDGQGGETPRLLKALKAEGLECRRLGRYHQVGVRRSGAGGDLLCCLYQRAFGAIRTVAFCDHESTVPLLRRVDTPLVVQSVASGQTRTLLTRVPASRLSVVDSACAWADMILEIADLGERNRTAHSS